MALSNSRIYKVAGFSLLGFCALSIGADRANVGPVASQVAGFCGAFLGALAAPRRKRLAPSKGEQQTPNTTQDPDAAKPQ